MTEADHYRAREVLVFAPNMEHAGDIVDRNLLGLVAKKIKRGLVFSKESQAELLALIDRLVANTRAAASLFMTEDARAARLLAAEKEAFRDIEARATAGAFRTPAHRAERDGGDELAAPRDPARPEARERAPGCGRGLSRAGEQGRAAAKPAAAGRMTASLLPDPTRSS